MSKDSKSDKNKVGKKAKKSTKSDQRSKENKQRAAAAAFSLLADEKTIDQSLSSLFAVKQPPVKAKPAPLTEKPAKQPNSSDQREEEDDNDAELSEIEEDLSEDAANPSDDGAESTAEEEESFPKRGLDTSTQERESAEVDNKSKRKRKRRDADEELENVYMTRLVREEERENEKLAAERAAKRQRQDAEAGASENLDNDGDSSDVEEAADESDSAEGEDKHNSAEMSPPPQHETRQQADEELDKANRTVFLGNVSTAAITSKASRKLLLSHLASFFTALASSSGSATPKVESIRFRSTPYAAAIPKKAAYAKQELMDATSKSTNAYAVYSSSHLAREAAKRLNGTVVLDRHLRVDEVAHPGKIDNRRCIFVGNLGFVSDESNIQAANEEEGREKRKPGKEPADVEEGLWRTFGKCGKVESVRVIRDSTTRVGKGIAYVQFEDENSVEAALLYNEKKFPPMLPRKLRVSRAKAQKRNAKPGSGRPSTSKPAATGYQRKLTGEEASKLGRASKLFGRAAAANGRRTDKTPRPDRAQRPSTALGEGIKKPENFIFEGHRATARQGKSGLKLAGKHAGKKNKVTKRSASYKAKKRPS
ncbi:Nucleolar 12 [Lecanosticta acicola]|uniref:Nucleolar protein 12 n=1 Tax=Lecanosticta acicola TaxID=111012 RepID=A0AAI9ECW3_9PEZI|nr:Nucleolar 12 [Lecanosticta acicola]